LRITSGGLACRLGATKRCHEGTNFLLPTKPSGHYTPACAKPLVIRWRYWMLLQNKIYTHLFKQHFLPIPISLSFTHFSSGHFSIHPLLFEVPLPSSFRCTFPAVPFSTQLFHAIIHKTNVLSSRFLFFPHPHHSPQPQRMNIHFIQNHFILLLLLSNHFFKIHFRLRTSLPETNYNHSLFRDASHFIIPLDITYNAFSIQFSHHTILSAVTIQYHFYSFGQ
jgi:hypothetical protein